MKLVKSSNGIAYYASYSQLYFTTSAEYPTEENNFHTKRVKFISLVAFL